MNKPMSFLSILHRENISSIYLFQTSGLLGLRRMISGSIALMKILAKATAMFVM